MVVASLLSIFASIFQGYGFISLLYNGDASQVSLKMMHLKFLSVVMAFPSVTVFGLLFYILGAIAFAMLVSLFHFPINYLGKWTCPANQMFNTNPYYPSYSANKALDAFPRHWIVVVCAFVFPFLLIFLPGGLLDGCATSTYFGSQFNACSTSIGRLMIAVLLPAGYVMQYIMMREIVKKEHAIFATAKHFVVAMLLSEIFFLITAIWFSSFSAFMFWANLASRAISVIVLVLHCLWQGFVFPDTCGHCATGGKIPPVTGTTPAGDGLRKAKMIYKASMDPEGSAVMDTEQKNDKNKKTATKQQKEPDNV